MQPTETSTPPESDDKDSKTDKIFNQAFLINKLNFINFIDGTIVAVYRQAGFDTTVRIPVAPLPCRGPDLQCRWVPTPGIEFDPASLCFDHLRVSDNGCHLFVRAELLDTPPEGPRFRLPETCRRVPPLENPQSINNRLAVRLFQKGVQFNGRLLNFSDAVHKIAIDFSPPQSSRWIDPEAPVYLVFADHREIYYSGAGVIDSHGKENGPGIYTVRTDTDPARRYKPKKYRSKRVSLNPAPDAVFTHPLSLCPVVSKIDDLSSLGFSMAIERGGDALLSGLIIPDVRLEMAGDPLAVCKVQVVHRHPFRDDEGRRMVRLGMAVLDMEIKGHTRLQRLVQQADNPSAYVSSPLESNALWRFFFDTGFIYPEKYNTIEDQKARIKRTYNKLYRQQPTFARHFTYQKRGTILGHIAMLRYYPRAWLIHHHAARSADATRAGLHVLEQIGQFINESHTLEAMHMEYIFFFYRPENRFPSLFFGKTAGFVDDPKKCSLDRFAYGHFRPDPVHGGLPPPWTLPVAGEQELKILAAFYEQHSGGLMADAFDLTHAPHRLGGLTPEYESIGFNRARWVFALKNNGRIHAFFEVNVSDTGLNLSDLTHCIKLFLLNAEALSRQVLSSAINQLASHFDNQEIPILIYPAESSSVSPVRINRHYMLWVLNLRHTDRYFAYTNRFVRLSRSKA